MESLPADSDVEFMLAFRETVEQYIRCIDEWEQEFQKRYTMARRSTEKLSPSLDVANAAYIAVRRKLEADLPRARHIAYVHDVHAPYAALLRVDLGVSSTAFAKGSGLGRNERLAIMTSLTQVIVACKEKSHAGDSPAPSGPLANANWGDVFTHVQRVIQRGWKLGLRRVFGRG